MKEINNTYIYITSLKEAESVIDWLLESHVLAIDTETTGLNPHSDKLRLIQIAVEGKPTVIIDYFAIEKSIVELFKAVFDSKSIKVFQNAKFDLKFLWANGFKVSGPIFDTMLAAQILKTSGGPRRAGLGVLCEHYLGIVLPKEEQRSDFSKSLSKSQMEYAAKDAAVLLPLRKVLIEYIKDNFLVELARIEFSCVYAVAHMEYYGIYLDLDMWATLTKEIEKRKDTALENLYPYIGKPNIQIGFFEEQITYKVNIDSPKQVLKLLAKNGIFIEDTSKHSMTQYRNEPIVKALLEYRHASKALNTFLYAIPKLINKKTKRLHPHYGQIGAWSGRMSCGGPNIQQIPRGKEFRNCFIAPKGRKLVIADYSQIELRVIAQISQDEKMIEAYRNGDDLHSLTASLISNKSMNEITKKERQAAKAVNFGLVFGMGAAGLKAYSLDTYGVDMTLEEANLFKEKFFKGYEGIKLWHNKIKGYSPNSSRTLAGRKHTYNENAGVSGRFNTPVQGSAADVLKNALGMLYLRIKDTNTIMVAVVHDEIILECDEGIANEVAELLKDTMAEAGKKYLKDIPVIADCNIGESWAEK